MAQYTKTSTRSGAWVKGSDLVGISKAKIISETNPEPSQFKNKDGSVKMQDVCKVKFDGKVGESKEDTFNLSLNKATINALVDAFGENSTDWMNQVLSVQTEKVRVGGVARMAVYLIPDGYELVDNDDGFAEIVKMGLEKQLKQPQIDDIPIIEENEINTKDIPF